LCFPLHMSFIRPIIVRCPERTPPAPTITHSTAYIAFAPAKQKNCTQLFPEKTQCRRSIDQSIDRSMGLHIEILACL
jgi:hypothetical protein